MYHRIGHIEFLIHTFITKFHSLNLFGIAINIDELFDCNYVSLSLCCFLLNINYQLYLIDLITPNHKFKWCGKSSASDKKCDSTPTTLKRCLCSSEVLKRRTSLYNWARVRNFNVSALCGVYLDSSTKYSLSNVHEKLAQKRNFRSISSYDLIWW